MYQVPVRSSSDSESDRRRSLWSDSRFGKSWRRTLRRRPRRYLLYAGLLVGFCVLLAFAGCGSTVGIGELKAAVSGINFGAVMVGQASTQTLTFTNTGTGAVDVSGVTVTGPAFQFAGPSAFPVTVAAGSTYSFRVQFSPSSAGNAIGQVTVDSDVSAGGLPTVSISGLGVQASAAASPAVLSGISCTNSSMAGAGTDNCVVALNAPAGSSGLSVSLASNNAAVKVPATVTVPATTAGVGFAATVAAVATAQTATLTATADGATQSFALEVNAAGGATPYQVDLSWNAPATSADPVAGYYVYRSVSGGSAYQLLNSKVNLTTTFTDSTVEDGQAYVYYVTSVDASGVESAPSSPFDVAIP
jgi:hypothetical protein